jgi:hypothetical protein
MLLSGEKFNKGGPDDWRGIVQSQSKILEQDTRVRYQSTELEYGVRARS